MDADPSNFTTDKTLINRDRLIKSADPEGTDTANGVYLELWEDRQQRRVWAVSILDDYRAKLGDGIHIRVSDSEAGWLKREYTVKQEDK